MRCWHSFCILGESLEALLYHEHDKKQEPSRPLAVELARLGRPTVASRTMAGVFRSQFCLGAVWSTRRPVYAVLRYQLIARATYLRCASVSVGRVKRPVFAALRYQLVARATYLAKPRFAKPRYQLVALSDPSSLRFGSHTRLSERRRSCGERVAGVLFLYEQRGEQRPGDSRGDAGIRGNPGSGAQSDRLSGRRIHDR